jgi:hypothetical protein
MDVFLGAVFDIAVVLQCHGYLANILYKLKKNSLFTFTEADLMWRNLK